MGARKREKKEKVREEGLKREREWKKSGRESGQEGIERRGG